MRKFIGYLITGAASFVTGGVVGYLFRKKTAEVTFEEVTEEEQAAAMEADGVRPEIKRPEYIQQAIDRTFGIEKKESVEKEDISSGSQVDTQKIQYFKQWKAEESAMENEQKNEEDLEEGIDQELLDEIASQQPIVHGADIEAATLEDWDHWLGTPDGDYDPVEVWWFDEDNVLTDEKGDPLTNPGKYMGFDVATKFAEIDEKTTGDPDIRVIYNHKENAIFQIIRKHGSYDRKTFLEEYGDEEEEDDEEQSWIHRHER